MTSEEATRGIAVEKFDSVKKWSINTYKVKALTVCGRDPTSFPVGQLQSEVDRQTLWTLNVIVQPTALIK